MLFPVVFSIFGLAYGCGSLRPDQAVRVTITVKNVNPPIPFVVAFNSGGVASTVSMTEQMTKNAIKAFMARAMANAIGDIRIGISQSPSVSDIRGRTTVTNSPLNCSVLINYNPPIQNMIDSNTVTRCYVQNNQVVKICNTGDVCRETVLRDVPTENKQFTTKTKFEYNYLLKHGATFSQPDLEKNLKKKLRYHIKNDEIYGSAMSAADITINYAIVSANRL